MKELWTEKYRPNTIDDYVWQDKDQEAQVKTWIEEKSIPHILLSGSAGTGKTTLAKILIKAMDLDPNDVMMLNASRENDVNSMRNKIINFASTMPFSTFKIILLDEADYLTLQAQAVLRGVMESYADNCRFILTCNYPNKILPAIHSRSQGFHVEKVDYLLFTERAAKILISEGVEFDLDTLDLYIAATYPDLRKCINNLQKASVDGKLMGPRETDASTLDYRIKMVDMFRQGKIVEGRKIATSNVRPDEIEDFFRWMYDNLDLWSDTNEGKDKAIIIIRNGLVTHSMIGDVEINLSATLAELTSINA